MMDDFLSAIDADSDKDNFGFKNAVDLTEEEVRGATTNQKSMHGRKKSLATRMPPDVYNEIMAAIRYWKAELQMTQNDIQLWCLLHGLGALADGVRPEVDEAEIIRPLKL